VIPARRRTLVRLVAVVVLMAVAGLVVVLGATWPIAFALAAVGVAVGAWAVHRLREERSAHEAALAEWAASEAVLTARLAIARDLHDLVSHGLGLITVRAATARFVNATEPDATDLLAALADVDTISRQATNELRHMLGSLRAADGPAPLRPADTLDTVPEIVDAARRAGLTVEVHAADLPPVSAGVQVAICAVVREGLANAARHAGTTSVQVSLAVERGVVNISVVDAGPAEHWRAAPGSGHGLAGLRERVTSLGGTLDAGPQSAGYRLAASLPDGPR
jgi:signal transduction histidine kinase